MTFISVVVCTHNPRMDYFARTLAALQNQTLPQDQWELLIVDNLCDEPLSGRIDLSWHSCARIIREEKPGLVHARLRGNRESRGDLIVIVDDDNVLAPDYLAAGLNLLTVRPDLGAISGCLLPEYEVAPPSWFQGEYESWLAIRRLKKSIWSNFLDSRSEPVGAGLCIRRSISEIHFDQIFQNPHHLLLGRRGKSLISGEDIALIKTSIALGYTVGQFVELKVTHLIPARRLHPAYLFSLYRHICASGNILGWLDTPCPTRESGSFRLPLRAIPRELYHFLFQGPIKRRLAWERFCARRMARKLVGSLQAEQS